MAYTTIDDPSAYFQVKTYTGTGVAKSETFDGNSDLQPDMLWGKNRSSAVNHILVDSNRGVTKNLTPNTTSAEATSGSRFTAFNSDGFSVGTSSAVNTSGNEYVTWAWKANGGTTSSNTDGSITSTVQANTDAGFSIVTYSGNSTSGATIGHGLGVAPNWIIVKSYDLAGNWMVGFTALDSTLANRCILNSDAAASSNTGDFNAAPTSSVFQVGSSLDVNGGKDYIAYCFAEKQGFSKFGLYEGILGSTNPIYTGFKPALVIIKKTSAENWVMVDAAREPNNAMYRRLFPNLNNPENTGINPLIDFNSNGFRILTNSTTVNSTNTGYIYMAFAENPFVTSTGIPTTAR